MGLISIHPVTAVDVILCDRHVLGAGVAAVNKTDRIPVLMEHAVQIAYTP